MLRYPFERVRLHRRSVIADPAAGRTRAGFIGQVARLDPVVLHIGIVRLHPETVERRRQEVEEGLKRNFGAIDARALAVDWPVDAHRSEEHTSELQSLMRTSYA